MCKESKGERIISKFLTNNNIVFIKEKRFDNCRDILPLPFDFYLPKYNTCIEFDGIQHYKIIDGRGKYNLEYIKMHDDIKNEYCNSNKISIIRIKYTESKNIEKILLDKLNMSLVLK